MSADNHKQTFIPLPKNTPAFICANCGAVSLDSQGICRVQGRGTKADWCGTDLAPPPSFCHNKVHNLRFKCRKCAQVSVNPELLCDPEEMTKPE